MSVCVLDLLDSYVAALQGAKRGEQTIDRYVHALRRFVSWADEGTTVPDITEDLVRAYQQDLGLRRQAARTIRVELSALRSFSLWCIRNRLRIDDPTLLLEWPAIPKIKTRALSPAELRALYGVLEQPPHGQSLWQWARNRRCIYVMLYAGLRIGEVAALTWEDTDLTSGVIHVINGKGGKDRDIPIAGPLWDILACLQPRERQGPVIPSGRRRRKGTKPTALSPDSLGHIFSRWLPMLGVEGVTAHRLRHTCAHYLRLYNADLKDIQLILGHESLATTELYLGPDVERLRDAIGRLPPLDRLARQAGRPRLAPLSRTG